MEKGSIAIDGISLTVASVTDSSFRVSIMHPYVCRDHPFPEKDRRYG